MSREHKGLNSNHKARKPFNKITSDNTIKLRLNRPTKTKRKTLKVI